MSSIVGAAGNAVPNPFGGFAPFPNSIMVPFMGYQSGVLGFTFGVEYEFGKRLVKSMDNETFNHIKNNQEGRAFFQGVIKAHNEELLQMFKDALPEALSTMDRIIEDMVKVEEKKAFRTPSAMVELLQALAAGTGRIEPPADIAEVDALVKLISSIYGLPLALVAAWLGVEQPPPPPSDGFTEEEVAKFLDLSPVLSTTWVNDCNGNNNTHDDQGWLHILIDHAELYKTTADSQETGCEKQTNLNAYTAHRLTIQNYYGHPYDELKLWAENNPR